MKLRLFAPLFLMLTMLAPAQTKPAESPAPSLSAEQKVSLLSLQHKLDATRNQMKDLDLQFVQIQEQTRTQFQNLQAQETSTKKELDAAIANAFKSARAEQSNYDLDLESLTFKAKPTKAEAAPPPAK